MKKGSEYHDHTHSSHESSLAAELGCHLPYAAFSVAFGFTVLAVMHFFGMGLEPKLLKKGYHILFHAFHYLHIMFAATGTFVTYIRFARNIWWGILLSTISPAIFCTLSDVALPTVAGNMLGIALKMHVCFFSFHDAMNVLPFLIMGIVCGLALSKHHEASLGFFSLGSHFVHILISSLASLFYVASGGFSQWPHVMGWLFFFIVIAVVVPCTISDIIIPMYFARKARGHEKHSS